MEQYFKILKLKPGASIEDVKRAYKAQVKVWHPDRFPSESPQLQKKAHEMFQKITAAYKKISDIHTTQKFGKASGWEGKSTQYTRASRKSTKTNPESEPQEPESVPGVATRIWPNGDKYNGNWKNGIRSGIGTFEWANGNKFIGEWQNDEREGYSIEIYSDGSMLWGERKENILQK